MEAGLHMVLKVKIPDLSKFVSDALGSQSCWDMLLVIFCELKELRKVKGKFLLGIRIGKRIIIFISSGCYATSIETWWLAPSCICQGKWRWRKVDGLRWSILPWASMPRKGRTWQQTWGSARVNPKISHWTWKIHRFSKKQRSRTGIVFQFLDFRCCKPLRCQIATATVIAPLKKYWLRAPRCDKLSQAWWWTSENGSLTTAGGSLSYRTLCSLRNYRFIARKEGFLIRNLESQRRKGGQIVNQISDG